jgi:hypothetical protein
MLYKIWWTYKGKKYAMVDVISATIYYRHQLVSTDYDRLKRLCDHLNFIACEDESYEVIGEIPRI